MYTLSLVQLANIERILQTVLGRDAQVATPRTEDQDEYILLVFENKQDLDNYADGFESEAYALWKLEHKEEFGFSFMVHDPGVRYHRDGSGTPPEDTLVEYETTYPNLNALVEGLALFIIQKTAGELTMSVQMDLNLYNKEMVPHDAEAKAS